MVRRVALDHLIGVRIPVSQPTPSSTHKLLLLNKLPSRPLMFFGFVAQKCGARGSITPLSLLIAVRRCSYRFKPAEPDSLRPWEVRRSVLYGETERMYGKSERMNSLAQLICSRVRSEIFRVLFGVKAGELHLREIQRQTGFAIGTVRQDIGKLIKLGGW